MIYLLDKKNLNNYIDNSFLPKNIIKDNLKNNPFGKYLLLQEDSKIIGYLYYSDIYERAEINQFEIEKNHRNCGKGTLLMKKFTSTVDKKITLEVNINNTIALNLK